jgi:hypothetical protein
MALTSATSLTLSQELLSTAELQPRIRYVGLRTCTMAHCTADALHVGMLIGVRIML